MNLPKKVGCVGSGTVGSSWALLYAMRGYPVVSYDVDEKVIARSDELVKNMLGTLVDHGILPQSDTAPILQRIRTTTRLDDMAGCDYLQESAVERLDVKIELFKNLESIIGDEAIIASSTSGLSMTQIQGGLNKPGRTVIAHPFNPPHLMPLVEIVMGDRTSVSTAETVQGFMESLGKIPVRVNKQLPGFAANRLQTAVLRESLAMLADGVVDADGLEKLMSAGLGLRWAFMGPIMTANLAGGSGGLAYYLEHFETLFRTVCETLSTWTVIPEPVKEEAKRQTELLVKDRSYPELVAWRDDGLIGILKKRDYL